MTAGYCQDIDESSYSRQMYLQCLVVSLQLPTKALQLAAGQDGLAVLALQVDLLLYNLRLLLLQGFQPLLHAAALLQLNTHSQHQKDRIMVKLTITVNYLYI